MDKSYFKVFFSKIKECQWLNQMGEKGYRLTKICDSKYHFESSPKHKYFYSIEYLDVSPQSETALEYYKSCESDGIVPVMASGNWVYMMKTDGVIDSPSEVYLKNSKCYFWRMLYLFFFDLCCAVLCGYQIFATKYLPKIGHESDGKFNLLSLEDNPSNVLEKLLNALKTLWNGILDGLNDGYLKLFTNIFGECDASIVIAFLIPLVVILSVAFAFNLEQYIAHHSIASKKSDKLNECSEGELYAE